MLSNMKQLMINNVAPKQKRVISALVMPSASFVDGCLFISCQKRCDLEKKPSVLMSCCLSLDFFGVFFSLFLSVMSIAHIIVLRKISGKKRKMGGFDFIFS